MTETTTPVLAYFAALVADDDGFPVTEAALVLGSGTFGAYCASDSVARRGGYGPSVPRRPPVSVRR